MKHVGLGFGKPTDPVFVDPRRWLGRSVRYLWGFPNQKPVLAVEADPFAVISSWFLGMSRLYLQKEWKSLNIGNKFNQDDIRTFNILIYGTIN